MPEQALRWGLTQVDAERDLCSVLVSEGWLDPAYAERVREVAQRPIPSTRHETEELGLAELPPLPLPPPPPDESGWPVDESGAAVPTVLGPYRVIQKLGQGGMGLVFLAEHVVLQRHVALKLIRPRDGAVQARALRRFEIEAQAMARLEHPNILKVLDIRVEAHQAYMVMDLARGGTLGERIHMTQEPLAIPDVVGWIEGLARGLHHAHEHAIVHRDVKPENVLFDEEGRPLLTDFGLAKALDRQSAGISTPGAMIGTLLYMAPEQVDGLPVDPRTDVYALGATLYEALTAEPPFPATTQAELIDMILGRPAPSPRKLRPEVPRDVETIVARCLAKDREERYPSAEALAEDCRRFLEQRPILARPVSLPERARLWLRRNPFLGLGLALATFALVLLPGVYDWLQQRERATRALESVDAARQTNVELEAQRQKASDAEREAVRARREAQESLARATYLQAELEANAGRRRRAATLYGEAAAQLLTLGESPFPAEVGRWDLWRRAPQALLPFPGPDPADALALAGDYAWIARGQQVEVWVAARGVLQERLELPPLERVTCLALSRDGKLGLAGTDEGSVLLWTLGSSAPRVLRKAEDPIERVALRSGGDFALSADQRGTVRFHALEREVEVLIPLEGDVRALQFVRGTTRFLVGLDAEVQLWDAQDTRRLATFEAAGVLLAAYDKKALAAGPGVAHLIDVARAEVLHRYTLGPHPLRALAFGQEGGLVLDDQGRAQELEIVDRTLGRSWDLVCDRVALAAFDARRAEPQLLAVEPGDTSGPRSPAPRLWRFAPSRHQRAWRGPRRPRTTLAASETGLLVSGCRLGEVEVWDPGLERVVATWKQPSTVSALAVRGERVVTGDLVGTVRAWELGNPKPVRELGPHLGGVFAVALSPGGQRVLAGGGGIPRRPLALAPDAPERQILSAYPTTPLKRVTLFPDGRLELEGEGATSRLRSLPLRLWDLGRGELLGELSTGRVDALAWTRHEVLSGGQGGQLVAWDLEGRAPAWRAAVPPPSEGITPGAQALVPLVSGWAFAAGPAPWRLNAAGVPERLGSGEGLGQARSLALDPRGRFLWSGHAGGELALWDLERRARLCVLEGHDGPLTGLAWLPTGELLSVGSDGRVLAWDFAQDASRAAVEVEVAQAARARESTGAAAPWPSHVVRRLAAVNGAWDLAREELQREGSPRDRISLARAERQWAALEALLKPLEGTRGRLRAQALARFGEQEQALREAHALLGRGRGDKEEFRRIVHGLAAQIQTKGGGDDARLHLALANLAESVGSEDQARRGFRAALDLDPELRPRFLTRGFLEARTAWNLDAGRTSEALRDLEWLRASELTLDAKLARTYAHLLFADGRYPAAIKALGERLDPETRRLRSEIHLRAGDAKSALSALDPQDKVAQSVLARARALRALGRLPDAERLLRAIVELNPRVEISMRRPVAFRYLVQDLERHEREPAFVKSVLVYTERVLGRRDPAVRFRIVAQESLEIRDQEFEREKVRHPELVLLEARVELARVLCRASRNQPEDERALLDEALVHVMGAIEGGLRDFEAFTADPDLALLHRRTAFQKLLAER